MENSTQNWFYDEFIQVGKDYTDSKEVELYETTHSTFRDIQQESIELLDKLKPKAEDVLVDFGCGTGVFVLEAAARCAKVYAVDVSRAMLDYAREKVQKAGINNIEFCHSGFLNVAIENGTVNFITSTFSFHHLPDFWKGIALNRMNKMLVTGGKLYLKDVVVTDENALDHIQLMINHQAKVGGDFMKEDAEKHFQEEFSTYDWVMEGLLSRAGFQIDDKDAQEGVLCSYLCTKIGV